MGTNMGRLEYTRPIYDKRGKTSVPEPIRQILELEEGDEIRWRYTNGTLTVEKVTDSEKERSEITAD